MGEGTSSGTMVRLTILVVILVLAVGAFGYDRFNAKPAYDRAYEKITEFEPDDLDIDDIEHPVDDRILVHELLDRKPAKQYTVEDDYVVEEYRYARGIPLMYYSIYVGYRRSQHEEDAEEYHFITASNGRLEKEHLAQVLPMGAFGKMQPFQGELPDTLQTPGVSGAPPTPPDDRDDPDDSDGH